MAIICILSVIELVYGTETINWLNEKADDKQDYRKLESLRGKGSWKLKSLVDKCRALNEYRNAECIGKREDGNSRISARKWTGPGFACGASGAAGSYETFEFWGFSGPPDFYSLPRNLRYEFLDKGIAFTESIFGENIEGIERILIALINEQDLIQLKLMQLKSEDIAIETRLALRGIASAIKEKAKAR